MIARGAPRGYAAEDGVALHYVGRRLVDVVSSRPDAAAYRVGLHRGKVVEKRLPARYLGLAEEVV
jgi:peptidase E